MSVTNFVGIQVGDNLSKLAVAGKTSDFRSIKLSKKDPGSYDTLIPNKTAYDAGFNFLTNQLSKKHLTPKKPKFYITVYDDIPMNYGGGLVKNIEYMQIDYLGILNENLFGEKGNLIPRVNLNVKQMTVPTFLYQVAYDLGWVETMMLSKVEMMQSVQSLYDEIVAVGFDLYVQTIGYVGNKSANIEGLFNSSKVQPNTIPACAKGTDDSFTDYTNVEIISAWNGMIKNALLQTKYNVQVMPNRALVPLHVLDELNSRTTDLLSTTLLEFILNYNLGAAVNRSEKRPGEAFEIIARPILDTMGTNETGRIVLYRKDEEFVRMDITQQIKAMFTMPNIERMADTTVFVGQLSALQLPYNEGPTEAGIVSYWDFGAAE